MFTNNFTNKVFEQDKEYRYRQQKLAEHRRLVSIAIEAKKVAKTNSRADMVDEGPLLTRLRFAAPNKLSTAILVIGLVLLVLVFVASFRTSMAQDLFNASSGPDSEEQSAGLDLMWLCCTWKTGTWTQRLVGTDYEAVVMAQVDACEAQQVTMGN